MRVKVLFLPVHFGQFAGEKKRKKNFNAELKNGQKDDSLNDLAIRKTEGDTQPKKREKKNKNRLHINCNIKR